MAGEFIKKDAIYQVREKGQRMLREIGREGVVDMEGGREIKSPVCVRGEAEEGER